MRTIFLDQFSHNHTPNMKATTSPRKKRRVTPPLAQVVIWKHAQIQSIGPLVEIVNELVGLSSTPKPSSDKQPTWSPDWHYGKPTARLVINFGQDFLYARKQHHGFAFDTIHGLPKLCRRIEAAMGVPNLKTKRVLCNLYPNQHIDRKQDTKASTTGRLSWHSDDEGEQNDFITTLSVGLPQIVMLRPKKSSSSQYQDIDFKTQHVVTDCSKSGAHVYAMQGEAMQAISQHRVVPLCDQIRITKVYRKSLSPTQLRIHQQFQQSEMKRQQILHQTGVSKHAAGWRLSMTFRFSH